MLRKSKIWTSSWDTSPEDSCLCPDHFQQLRIVPESAVAMHSCGKESQQHPGLHHQQDKGPDPSSLLNAGEATSGVLDPVLGSIMNISCHPVSNQRQGLAPTSLRVGDRPLCSPSGAPCPSSVVSEGRWNQEQLQAPGSRSVTLCAHRDFLSLLPRPQTRPFKGNVSGNSRCCKHPSQSQRHDLSVAGGHPAQPFASQKSYPHPSRYN